MSGENTVAAESTEVRTGAQIEVIAAVAEVNQGVEIATALAPPRTGRLFVVSGPSGVGKDAVLERLFASLPGVDRSISATTRAARETEVDGVDYHFLTTEQFEADIAADCFLEYAQYNGRYYGTPQARVAEQLARGVDVVLKIEVQGAQTVRRLMPQAVLIFILPPSLAVLEQRLRGRKTDDEEKIAARLRIARDEIAAAAQYDYAIVNDRLEAAVDVLRCIVIAERHRKK
jgi:guanylate kinase